MKKNIPALLSFAIALFFTSCQLNDPVASADQDAAITFTEAECELEDLNQLANPPITDASVATALAIRQGDQERIDPAKPNPRTLLFILRQLELQESQKVAIKGFLAAHRACTSNNRQEIRDLHLDLVRRANARRDELLTAFKAGTMTRAELQENLEQLNARVRAELKEQEGRHKFVAGLMQCRMALVSNIESVLLPEQLPRWNRWKASLR